MKGKIIYFPGLNGLRAIAAIAVVISHITLSLNEFNLDPYIFGSFNDGKPKGLLLAGYGVSVFFVISGFLITYLLQVEKEVGGIKIFNFYMRRILRIWPLYYLFFFLAIITIIVFGVDFNIGSLFFYVFYAANIPFVLQTTLPFLSHYWSLGVEEQFYTFWPWFNKIVKKHISIKIIILIVLLIGVKIYLHFTYPNSIIEEFIHVTRFHCMLIGGLGAILYKSNNKIFLSITNNKLSQSICWLIFCLVAINKFHFISVIDNELICVVTLIIIIGQIEIKNRMINIEIGIFDYLGKISYGIYIIHPLLIFFSSKIISEIHIERTSKYFIVYSFILGITILCSHLSYYYFEKYFMNLKNKFSIVKSSATRV